jgi:hypothetical protein
MARRTVSVLHAAQAPIRQQWGELSRALTFAPTALMPLGEQARALTAVQAHSPLLRERRLAVRVRKGDIQAAQAVRIVMHAKRERRQMLVQPQLTRVCLVRWGPHRAPGPRV